MVTKAFGFFEHDLVRAYLTDFAERPDPECLTSDLDYFYDPDLLGGLAGAPVTVCAEGEAKMGVPAVGQCLCLDVGSWTGNGPKDARNHTRHREFGLVCGNIAVLCEYPGERGAGKAQAKDDGAEDAVRALPIFKDKILPFLDYLSSDQEEKHGLGQVKIVSALTASDQRCTDLDTETIHVFLGDLHLPALTELDKTYLPLSTLPLPPALAAKSPALRAGRLDLSEETKSLVTQIAIACGFAVSPVPFSSIWAGLGIGVLVRELRERQSINMPRGITDDGVMTRAEARDWFIAYDGTQKKKGADIFQGAAVDLLSFLRLLVDRPPELGAADLTQLGDFCDFWIGMKCGFGEHVVPRPGAFTFVNFWKKQMRQSSRVGDVFASFDALRRHPRLPTTVLSGNHDNYLRLNGHAPSRSDKGNTFFAEHGHQSDSFNCDEDATNGWALTQTAYLFPEIRDVEDPASAAITVISRGVLKDFEAYPARLQRLARAADVCMTQKKLIYVMGHTHRPCLRRITMKAACDRAKIRQSWYSGMLIQGQNEVEYCQDLAILSARVMFDLNSADLEQKAQEAASAIADAIDELLEAQRKYERAKEKAILAVIDAAIAARDAAAAKVAELVLQVVKAIVIADLLFPILKRLAIEIAEQEYRRLGQELCEHRDAAIALEQRLQKEAKLALDNYLAALNRDLENAKRAARASYDDFLAAGRWLVGLPGEIKKDIEDKATECYREFLKSIGYPGFF